jgi:hypothetical protein
MIGLNELWYSQSPRQSFHFFNDASEWKQVDKVGHFLSTFQVSHVTYKTLGWANVEEKRRAISSSVIAFAVISSIEIFDGLSSNYVASLTYI